MTKFALVLGLLVFSGALSGAVVCSPTVFVRDSINMTAALVNPAGTVSGDVDATGCNIGIYYDHGTGVVRNANVHGANYFGIVVNGDNNVVSVDVISSTVSNIGDSPFNGNQHGVGIYYRALVGPGRTTGNVTGSVVAQYQKGGIVAVGASSLTISGNTVSGLGRVPFIAQNGIEIAGASAQVKDNLVTGNAYTGTNCASSAGILVLGGDLYGLPFATGTQITGNTVVNNDVGVWLSNLDGNFLSPSATNIKVVNNTITNDGLTNIGGCGFPGYQAGVSDQGNNDKIVNDTISGAGYTSPGNAATSATPIDTTSTNRPKVHAIK